MVDVVVELRDSRVPHATTHPSLPTWVGSRGHVLVLNRIDSVPPRALDAWADHLRSLGGPEPLLVDARKGSGVPELKKAILKAGQKVNERRKRRGINPRPIRAAILGYPNVGKSALINRLVGRRKTKSENRPGVTRGFTWVRIDPQVQLLDSPGSSRRSRSSSRPRTISQCATTLGTPRTTREASRPHCLSGWC